MVIAMETSVDTSLVEFSLVFFFPCRLTLYVCVHLQSHNVQPYFSDMPFSLLFYAHQTTAHL